VASVQLSALSGGEPCSSHARRRFRVLIYALHFSFVRIRRHILRERVTPHAVSPSALSFALRCLKANEGKFERPQNLADAD
jgi:hypothetical protein